MSTVRQLFSRLRKHVTKKRPEPRPLLAAANSPATVPAIPGDLVNEELKQWARKAEVDVDPVEGVWWYHGDQAEALRAAQEGRGLVGLQLHGGGYVLGSAKDVLSGGSRIPRGVIEHGICSCLLAVEYSLVNDAKNCAFPLQILEALSAYHHLVHTLNIPPRQILLIGDSAGAHLALALQRYLLQGDVNVMPLPGGLILLSPWCDLSVEAHNPHIQRLLGPLAQDQLANPYFSPALHAPPDNWPPTLIYYGASERFKESITTLSSRLAEGGTRVTTFAAETIPERFAHDFLLFLSVERAWPDEVSRCWTKMKAWADGLESA